MTSIIGVPFFIFCAVDYSWRSSWIICAGWRTFTPHKGNDRIAYNINSVYGKSPTRQLHGTPIAVSGSGHTGNLTNSLKLSSVCKSASQAVLSRMHLTLYSTHQTPHGVSRLVQAMPPSSVKTRHAPSRHCRYAKVNIMWSMVIRLRPCMNIEYPPPLAGAPWRRLATTL